MRNAVYIIFSYFIIWPNLAVAQENDTLYFETKSDFERAVKYAFMDNYWNMPSKLVRKIERIYTEIDFDDQSIPCQNDFTFTAHLDSCGNILKSTPANNDREHEEQRLFEEKVNKIISKSNWKVNNTARFSDTIIVFDKLRINIELDCDPKKVVIAPKGWNKKKNKILAYFDQKGELVVFTDFTNICSRR